MTMMALVIMVSIVLLLPVSPHRRRGGGVKGRSGETQ